MRDGPLDQLAVAGEFPWTQRAGRIHRSINLVRELSSILEMSLDFA